MASSLLDLVQLLIQQAQPRPDLITPGSEGQGLSMVKPATFMGRLITTPETPINVLKRAPTETPEGEGMQGMARGLIGAGGAAGMAKQFKPGPATLETYIADLVKQGEAMPARSRLLPTIKTPAGELFSNALGESHPIDTVVNTLTNRKQIVGNLTYGYKPTYEGAPFVPESVANYLGAQGKSNPANAVTLNNLLKRGISLETINELLKGGKLP